MPDSLFAAYHTCANTSSMGRYKNGSVVCNPKKPTVASECCSCPNVGGNVRGESFQGGCIAGQTNASDGLPFMSGTFVWTLHDYYVSTTNIHAHAPRRLNCHHMHRVKPGRAGQLLALTLVVSTLQALRKVGPGGTEPGGGTDIRSRQRRRPRCGRRRKLRLPRTRRQRHQCNMHACAASGATAGTAN